MTTQTKRNAEHVTEDWIKAEVMREINNHREKCPDNCAALAKISARLLSAENSLSEVWKKVDWIFYSSLTSAGGIIVALLIYILNSLKR